MVRVEIVAVGNEILLGDVLNTNTNWLCKQVTGLGGQVQHAAVVRDDVKDIACELRMCLARGAEVIFTTGGLGPTADDKTLAGVALAFDAPLELNDEALSMVQTRYRELAEQGYVKDAHLTEERRKMAFLPRGARPLHNPVGTAPGVVLEARPRVKEGAKPCQVTVIALPGVPEEMRGIFETSLQPLLRELFGEGFYREQVVVVECGDESVLAPVVDRLARQHPRVYIKSRAKAFGPGVRLKVTFSASGNEKEEVEALLEEALADFRRELEVIGISLAGGNAPHSGK